MSSQPFFFFLLSPPEVLLKLHTIADQEDGWIKVINSMVSVIPIDNPLGPAVIVFLLDDCPLPNKVNFDLMFLACTNFHNYHTSLHIKL